MHFFAITRTLLALILVSSLSACSLVYKLSISQGNVIDEKKLAKVETGMSEEQVRFLLGSPLVQDEFMPNRWDYVAYYRTGEGKESHRSLSLYFEGGKLARIDDSKPAKEEPAEPVAVDSTES